MGLSNAPTDRPLVVRSNKGCSQRPDKDLHPAGSSTQNLTRNDFKLPQSASDSEDSVYTRSFTQDGCLIQWN